MLGEGWVLDQPEPVAVSKSASSSTIGLYSRDQHLYTYRAKSPDGFYAVEFELTRRNKGPRKLTSTATRSLTNEEAQAILPQTVTSTQ
jgi:hypothetical protein